MAAELLAQRGDVSVVGNAAVHTDALVAAAGVDGRMFQRGPAQFEEQALLSEAMTRMLGELESGVLRPLPVTEIPLADAAEAHKALQSGKSVGKLVLVP